MTKHEGWGSDHGSLKNSKLVTEPQIYTNTIAIEQNETNIVGYKYKHSI